MSALEFGLQLLAPLSLFDGRTRDRIIVRIGDPRPLTLVRDLPPYYGAIMAALHAGTVVPLNPARSTSEILDLMAAAAGPPTPERRTYGRLELVKGGAP